MGHQVTLAARRRGAVIRPLGDVIVLMPPLSIDEADFTGSSTSPAPLSTRRRAASEAWLAPPSLVVQA
jgi:adenosylmethionine-8-amino-7-oxononanoate aminotransferase